MLSFLPYSTRAEILHPWGCMQPDCIWAYGGYIYRKWAHFIFILFYLHTLPRYVCTYSTYLLLI